MRPALPQHIKNRWTCHLGLPHVMRTLGIIFRNSYKVILAFKNSSHGRNQHQQLRHALCSFTRSEIWTHPRSKQWILARSLVFYLRFFFPFLFSPPTWIAVFSFCFPCFVMFFSSMGHVSLLYTFKVCMLKVYTFKVYGTQIYATCLVIKFEIGALNY